MQPLALRRRTILALALTAALMAPFSYCAETPATKLAGKIKKLFSQTGSFDQTAWKAALDQVQLDDPATKDALTPVVRSAVKTLMSEGAGYPDFVEGLARDQKRLLARVMILDAVGAKLGACLDQSAGQDVEVAQKYARYHEFLDEGNAKLADKWMSDLTGSSAAEAEPAGASDSAPAASSSSAGEEITVYHPLQKAAAKVAPKPPLPEMPQNLSRPAVADLPGAEIQLIRNYPPKPSDQARQASVATSKAPEELAVKVGKLLNNPDSFDKAAWKAAFKTADLKDPATREKLTPVVQSAAQALIDEGGDNPSFDQQLAENQNRLLARAMKLHALYSQLNSFLNKSAAQDTAVAQKYSEYYDLLDPVHAKSADKWTSELRRE